MSRSEIDYYVLDALANDLEDIEHTLAILNSPTDFGWRDQHPDEFTANEIVPALLRGIREGNIEACAYSQAERALIGMGERVLPSGPLDEIWFRLTDRGRAVLNSWEPPSLPADD